MAMDVKLANAAEAYAKAIQQADQAPVGGVISTDEAGKTFADYFTDAAQEVGSVVQRAEQVSLQATTGKTDVIDVVSAVNNAELALESVVAVRDRVIEAYQQIIRMPI